jgi:hypothetical protein
MEAWGQFGHAIIFTRAGDARNYFKPSNPRSVDQMANRIVFGAMEQMIKILNETTRAALRAAVPKASYWSATLMQVAIGTNIANWRAGMAVWAQITQGLPDDWDAAAAAAGIPWYHVPDFNENMHPGFLLLETMIACVRLGYNPIGQIPDSNHNADWAAALVG